MTPTRGGVLTVRESAPATNTAAPLAITRRDRETIDGVLAGQSVGELSEIKLAALVKMLGLDTDNRIAAMRDRMERASALETVLNQALADSENNNPTSGEE